MLAFSVLPLIVNVTFPVAVVGVKVAVITASLPYLIFSAATTIEDCILL